MWQSEDNQEIVFYLELSSGDFELPLDHYLAVIPEICQVVNRKSKIVVMHQQADKYFNFDKQDVVVVAGLGALSVKLLQHYRCIWVRISHTEISVNESIAFSYLSENIQQYPTIGAILEKQTPLIAKASLISSVFHGDQYIDAFITTSVELVDYPQLEHLIALVPSQSNEFARLLAMTSQHSNVVLIRLKDDPGLYAVWNHLVTLCCSKFISNSNIDDLRHPVHVETLTSELENNTDADVAATALYISNEPNVEVKEATSLPIWYATPKAEIRTGASLSKVISGKLVAYNFLHCMPVWRASLHVLNGDFDEVLAGPSADWEFWLRCAIHNSQFILQGKPLGVHYKAPDSYWRRESTGDSLNFNDIIIEKYFGKEKTLKISPAIVKTKELVGAVLENINKPLHLMNALLQCIAPENSSLADGESFKKLINYVVNTQGIFGGDFFDFTLPNFPGQHCGAESKIRKIIRLLALILKNETVDASNAKSKAFFKKVSLDLYCTGFKTEALILLAKFWQILDQAERESSVLKYAYSLGSVQFWRVFQDIYLFEKTLPKLMTAIGKEKSYFSFDKIKPIKKLYFFPDYTKANPYQLDLYENLKLTNTKVVGINTWEQLADLSQSVESGTVVHIHWINAFFEKVADIDLSKRADDVITLLASLKAVNYTIIWTVHNRYSHSGTHTSLEKSFRASLSTLVDTVILHHPAIIPLISEWLSEKANVQFLEHGPYNICDGNQGGLKY